MACSTTSEQPPVSSQHSFFMGSATHAFANAKWYKTFSYSFKPYHLHNPCQMYPEPVLHLHLPDDPQGREVELGPLMAPSMASPLQNQLFCGLSQCGTREVPATLQVQPGSVLIVNLARLGFGPSGTRQRLLIASPVQEPQDGQAAFFGKQMAAVLVSTPGHWITYIKLRGVWWCVDSVGAHAVQRNPFQCQSPQHMIMQLWFSSD